MYWTMPRLWRVIRHPCNIYESDKKNEARYGNRDVSDLGVHVKPGNSGWWESLAKGSLSPLVMEKAL